MITNNTKLSRGQLEVRRIVDSFLEEFESLDGPDFQDKFSRWYPKVIDAFSSNKIIVKDAVTAQPLGTSRYCEKYLSWLHYTGEVESIKGDFHSTSLDIDFSMHEILYRPDGRLRPAYKGGVKSDTTIESLFYLAQGKRLHSFQWDSTYYDAIALWEEGMGGHHRMLSHILYGSDNINPRTLCIVRNESPELALNESLLRLEKLFNAVSTDSNTSITLDFDPRSVSREEIEMIKSFFHGVTEKEKVMIIRCIKDLRKFYYQYCYLYLNSDGTKMSITAMYRLLGKVRTIRAKPLWWRRTLVWKQKLLGLNAVDPINSSVLRLATRDNPYWADKELSEEGLLSYLPGLHIIVSWIWKQFESADNE
ncbi:hypothetical protein S7335_1218 [Synechococcus sp. PCC 7335]|uniref:hypothetical protein n=1 Tax=Synechococcus sp. (strain ATCC 29403 / PCC 7335) TaxID=91464 RepID=UPI00017EB566|nr:hypothetical protein [Synechococcus sp. PCC 7335]EDX82514.1 hypothetical protein S7335_1218 [Synechococcus sp. PCC 7335]